MHVPGTPVVFVAPKPPPLEPPITPGELGGVPSTPEDPVLAPPGELPGELPRVPVLVLVPVLPRVLDALGHVVPGGAKLPFGQLVEPIVGALLGGKVVVGGVVAVPGVVNCA